MYNGLQHAHSGLRWIVLVLLLVAIVSAWRKMAAGQSYAEGDRKLSLYALIATHLQLVIGIILYFISPYVQFTSGVMKDTVLRFFTVEHITIMLIGIALITVGYSRAKRAEGDRNKFRAITIFYGIGLLLILLGIPWPFRIPGAGWF